MKSLQEIKDFAKAQGACNPQYNKFCEFVESGDELKAWQTVLGNIDWLNGNGAELDIHEACELAQGIGLRWHDNGILNSEEVFVNGKLHGARKIWDDSDNALLEEVFEDGVRIK